MAGRGRGAGRALERTGVLTTRRPLIRALYASSDSNGCCHPGPEATCVDELATGLGRGVGRAFGVDVARRTFFVGRAAGLGLATPLGFGRARSSFDFGGGVGRFATGFGLDTGLATPLGFGRARSSFVFGAGVGRFATGLGVGRLTGVVGRFATGFGAGLGVGFLTGFFATGRFGAAFVAVFDPPNRKAKGEGFGERAAEDGLETLLGATGFFATVAGRLGAGFGAGRFATVFAAGFAPTWAVTGADLGLAAGVLGGVLAAIMGECTRRASDTLAAVCAGTNAAADATQIAMASARSILGDACRARERANELGVPNVVGRCRCGSAT